MEKDLITFLSLGDYRKASAIKKKLEQAGIRCYFNKLNPKNTTKIKVPTDLLVSLKDLDKALKVIENHEEENPESPANG